MRITMTREFHYMNVDIYVDDSGDFWVTREQIGRMLNYRTPERSIRLIQERFEWHFNHMYKEVELNIRSKGICKVIAYNFDGLLEVCSFSGKSRAAEVVNFLWQVKYELEHNQPACKSGLQLFSYGQRELRAFMEDGEVWFVGKDIASALGYKDTDQAIRTHVDERDKLTREIDGTGQKRAMTVINESGMYSLILASKLPAVKEFKHWVTSEVLPSIRRTGNYSIGAKKMLTGQATDTRFYSASEIGRELGMSDDQVLQLACEHKLMEEGREKIQNAARI